MKISLHVREHNLEQHSPAYPAGTNQYTVEQYKSRGKERERTSQPTKRKQSLAIFHTPSCSTSINCCVKLRGLCSDSYRTWPSALTSTAVAPLKVWAEGNKARMHARTHAGTGTHSMEVRTRPEHSIQKCLAALASPMHNHQ